MALIQKSLFSKVAKDRIRVHEPVDATYSLLIDGDKRYFQIDTYGSADREIKGKVSQSIQVDEEMARELIHILKTEFSID